jgi:hypothetical protein
MLVFGGFDGSSSRSDLWQYTAPLGWQLLIGDGVGGPSGRVNHSAVWDPNGKRMLVFGGINGGVTQFNDLWQYTQDGGWQLLSPQGAPGAPPKRKSHSAVWDDHYHRLLIYGGTDGNKGLNDLWAYTDGTWQQLSSRGAWPTKRSFPAVVWDNFNVRMLVFGGWDKENLQSLNDLWQFTAATGWTQLSTNGSPGSPEPTFGREAAWDPHGDRMVVFGGCCDTNELWQYTLVGGWKLLSSDGAPGAPKARMSHSVVWDLGSNRLLVYGGGDHDLSDLWSYHFVYVVFPEGKQP